MFWGVAPARGLKGDSAGAERGNGGFVFIHKFSLLSVEIDLRWKRLKLGGKRLIKLEMMIEGGPGMHVVLNVTAVGRRGGR